MINIGIVILHYLNVEETRKCIASYKTLDKTNLQINIVVVDNGSNNGSGELLEELTANEENISILRLEKNLGFAKGNNAGLQFLKSLHSFDFIVYSNSDIEFLDKNFYNWIVSDYKKYKFSVLGPDIYSVNNKFHQSPCQNMDIKTIKKFKQKYPIRLFTYFILSLMTSNDFLLNIYLVLQKIYKKNINNYKNILFNQIITKDVTLHGALFVLSRDFLKEYPNGICDETFLYFEENILKCYCEKKGLKMVYDGTYCVNHMQAASTSILFKGKYDREIFRLKEMRKSADILLKYLGN